MVTIKNAYVERTMMTLAGVGLLGLASLAPAVAQNRTMSNGAMRSNSDMRGMRADNDMDDDDMADPASMNYPMATPGGLHLYHYRTYRHNEIVDGSVQEAREQHEMRMDRKMRRGWIKDDERMADPMPLSYPLASPGALDLYHFHTYRGNTIMAGSPTEERERKMMEMDRQRRMETRITDDEEMADPMPMQYPLAAPGALDLYHFHTYRGNTLMEGSATEARERREMKRDQKRMNDANGANK